LEKDCLGALPLGSNASREAGHGRIPRRAKRKGNGFVQKFGVRSNLLDKGVSKYHFPTYLKEVEYRFNHRNDNLFKLFMSIHFGYVSH